ncbi:MAG: pseudouridine synthase [Spirochaetota bacterium]
MSPEKRSVRLQAFLAKCGFGSRRSCEQLIEEGKVSVNGKTVTSHGVKVSSTDQVMCCGQVATPYNKVYIAVHKPVGYVVSNADPHNSLLAINLIDIPEKPSLFHVGRLDKDSSGLILYTNDGEFSNLIAHPSHEIEKEYIVTLSEKPDMRRLTQLSGNGIVVDGIRYRCNTITSLGDNQVAVTLHEGKNREIRRAFSYLEHPVYALHRIRIDGIVLGNLPQGSFRYLSNAEIQSIRESHIHDSSN